MDSTEAGSIEDSFDSKNYAKMDSDVADSVDDSHDSRDCAKMESTAEDSYDSRNYIKMDEAAEDSYDSRNLEVVVQGEEINYEDCNAEVLSSQNEEDQSGEQVYGLINFGDGRENATIYLDPHSIINGQPMILSQNHNGNEIIFLINAEGQPLVHQVLHPNEINFDGLKENDTIIVGEHSQSLEFMKTDEDVQVQECEEKQELIESSEEMISTESGNECCPVDSVDSSQWPVTNSEQLKSDSSKMLFIPNPTVVLAPNVQESEERHMYTENTGFIPPQETKHPKSKLLLLSDVARDHLLLSASQKNNILAVGDDGGKDLDSQLPEYENSVIVTHTDIEKDPKAAISESETDECSPSIERDSSDFDSIHTKSVDVTSLSSSTSTRIVDNTVSVIHTTSEVQDSSLENLTKPSSPDYCSDKQFHLPENELPSEILYCNVSRESFRYNLDRSSDNKQIAECATEDLEDNSRSSIPHDSNESVSTVNNFNSEELSLASAEKDSQIHYIEKSQNLEEETLGIKEDPLEDTEMKDVDSPSDSCTQAVTLDESKEVDKANDVSDQTRSNSEFENSLKKNADNGHIIFSNKKVVNDPYSEDIGDDDEDDVSRKPYTSLSKEKILFSTKHMSSTIYKPKWRQPSSIRNLISYSTSQEDTVENKTSPSKSQCNFNESDIKQLKEGRNKEESSKSEPMELENSPSGNLVIAESADEEFTGDEVQNSTDQTQNLREDSESQSTKGVEMSEAQPLVSVAENAKDVSFEKALSGNSEKALSGNSEKALSVNSEATETIKTAENEPLCINMESTSLVKDNEDFSNNEETLVKPPKKTYIRKKKILDETKPKENIVLFDDLDFTGCDKDITETEKSLISDQQKEDSVKQFTNLDHQKEGALSSKENNESDDQLLLSDVQSKVSATYIRKKKFVPKHGLRSQSSRLQGTPTKLSLENGTSHHDSKKNFDSSSSENTSFRSAPLWTPLQHCNDGASTSFAPQSPIESTPLLSPEQERRKINKSKRDFDRLLNSSPIASKQVKTSPKRHFGKGQPKGFQKKFQAKFLKRRRSKFSGTKKSLCITSSEIENKHTDTDDSRAKEARIQDLSQEPLFDSLVSQLNNEEVFSCSQCNFSSAYVDNLIEHLKYCKRDLDKAFGKGVNDMDKRQRIRGEPSAVNDTNKRQKIRGESADFFKTPEELTKFYQHSMEAYKQIQSEEFPVCLLGADEADLDSRRARYGYGEDDVVWVKIKMNDSEYRSWPALIIHLEKPYETKTKIKRKRINKKFPKDIRAHVMLINHPKEIKGLKVRHEHIRTFDDYKWNVLCLTEAENLPDSETFLKAVQSAEVFMRRKFLGLPVKGKEFFSVQDEDDFTTDSASSSEDIEKVERWKTQTARQARYDKLDVERILKFILEGQTDDYVIGIFKGNQDSKKHEIFFNSDSENFYPLKGRVWFGPCEKKSQQDQLYNYFRELFVNQIGDFNYVTAYVLQVWVPEALVKAISVVQNITLEEAENLFESDEEMFRDKDSLDEDSSIKDSDKLQS